MLKIDSLKNNSFLNEEILNKKTKAINSLKEKRWNLWFMDLDENIDTEKIKKFVEKNKKNFESIVVLWIWWSALWTKAILEALKWKYYNELSKSKRKNFPKIYVLDNIDPTEIKNIIDIISLKKTLFIVISKSGTTIETLSQYNFFKEKLEKKDLKIEKHFVFIAWEKSEFALEKEKEGFEVFTIPENVGWRFSVFSNVWLLPLAFAWIDIEKLLLWQKNIKNNFFEDNLLSNIALKSALLQFDAYKNQEKNITVFFPYFSNFRSLWLWYKQIFNESLGKNWIWPTLTTAIWTTDQHSDLQLFMEWPNDKFIIFLEVSKFEKNYKIEKDWKMKFSNLLNIEKYATSKALSEKWVLNYSLKIDKIDEENLWELIFFFEMQVAFLWEFLEINAFNQPWVEAWKIIAKERIKKIYSK